MNRYMGLDVGDKWIGVAVSDPLLITSQALETIERKEISKDIGRIIEIIKEYNINKIIVGLPKNMDNSLGFQSEKVINFVDKLKEKIDIEVIYQDERLTTVEAERILIDADLTRKKRKKVIDQLAASYILQNYLDRI